MHAKLGFAMMKNKNAKQTIKKNPRHGYSPQGASQPSAFGKSDGFSKSHSSYLKSRIIIISPHSIILRNKK